MGRRLPEVLTRDEARALLATPNRYYPTGQRDRCLLKLMLNAGLRASEVLSLTWRDVDLQTGKLLLRRAKGDKDRQVWVNDETLALLRAWRERTPPSPYCFPTLKGTRIYSAALREMVKRRGRKAGISKDVHPHMLRHTYATELYRATKDIRLVQKALGHVHLSTTMIYTHIVGSCTRSLRIIPSAPKSGKMPSSQHMWEGATRWCHIILSISSSYSHSSGSSSCYTSPGPSQA